MSSITTGFDSITRAGKFITYPVAAGIHLYPGGLVALDASGNLNPASDTAGLRVVGRNEDDSDNTGGIAGAISSRVARRCFRYLNSTGDALTAANVGMIACVENDSTVNKTGGTNRIVAGRVVALDALGVWIDTDQAEIGVKPSHKVIFGGQHIWATASIAHEDVALVGTLSTDLVLCTLTVQAASETLLKAVPAADKITITLSANGTQGTTIVTYQVLRAAQ